MQLIRNHQGLSLPIATGVVVLLMTAAAALHLTVIRTLRSGQQIEAAARAYAAAEGGVEEALYDLSDHFAGYQTPPLGDQDARTLAFEVNRWTNQWAIVSRGQSPACADPAFELCGQMSNNRKTLLSLFNDTGAAITTLELSEFVLKLQVPAEVITASEDNDAAFGNIPPLVIDNDLDAWEVVEADGVNEDGDLDSGTCGLLSSRDHDCDGREDEDNPEDPVVYWKFSDNLGNSLVPKKGCLHETEPGLLEGSELCEKNFVRIGDDLSVTLDIADVDSGGAPILGVMPDGTEKTIADFLTDIPAGSRLQLELLVVAPLEQVDSVNQKKIPIPALEYSLHTVDQNNEIIPDPFFVIQSDGQYLDFKQSITTTITPKTTVPLVDFTVVQQQ